jgi:hypothetical protein
MINDVDSLMFKVDSETVLDAEELYGVGIN